MKIKRHYLTGLLLISSCATAPKPVILTPISHNNYLPSTCKISYIFPGSPAEKSGIKLNDKIQKINGLSAKDVDGILNLLKSSSKDVVLELTRDKKSIVISASLNDTPPRLGIKCDLDGVEVIDYTADKSRKYIISQKGPYEFSAFASIISGLTFVHVRIANYSDHAMRVDPLMFSAADGNRIIMNPLSPSDVMYILHGDRGARMAQSQQTIEWANAAAANARANATYTTNTYGYSYGNYYNGYSTTQQDSGSAFASNFYSGYALGAAIAANQELENAQTDATFIGKESLKQQEVPTSFSAEGFIYFPAPKILPMTILTNVEGHNFEFAFNVIQDAP